MCSIKLDRAQKLIAGLGGEKTRWTARAAELGAAYTALTGDVIIASAAVAYLGPVTATYRADVLKEWIATCGATGVPCSPTYSLEIVLGDPVLIR